MNKEIKPEIKPLVTYIKGFTSITPETEAKLYEHANEYRLTKKTILSAIKVITPLFPLFYVTEGFLLGTKEINGKTSTTSFINPGEVITASRIGSLIVNEETIETITPCFIIVLDAEIFSSLEKDDPGFGMAYRKILRLEVSRLEKLLHLYHLKPAERLNFFYETGLFHELIPKIREKDIAQYLDITPEGFSRFKKRLAAKKV